MRSCSLYLVRHGVIESRSGKSFVGQIDIPLSQEGIEQARALRRWLEPVRFSRVLSSDLARTQHTCEIIAGFRSNLIETLPALREISLGEWEGLTFQEIKQRFPEEYAARGRDIEKWRPPGGESFAECRARVMPALLETLDQSRGNILLVGHAGVNRLILCDALEIPIANLHRIVQDYGCLNVIHYSADRTRVQLLNFTPPLPAARDEEGMICGAEARN